MDVKIKKDILAVLKKAMVLIRKRDYAGLTEISNHTIHTASVVQDEDSLSIAVLILTLAKVIEKCASKGMTCPAFVMSNLKKAEQGLHKHNDKQFRSAIKNLMHALQTLDKKVKLYIAEVVDRAKIKKGGKLNAHGVSAQRAAAMLGISSWELLEYLGKTNLPTEGLPSTGGMTRLRLARKIFS
jgi:hypothetical protein